MPASSNRLVSKSDKINVSHKELLEKSLCDKRVLINKCNSESEEWIARNPSMDDNIFSHFSLMNFLNYDLTCIPSGTSITFAKALKLKILDNIMEVKPPYREQLEILCKITDGNQTERNQNIITMRMLTILNKQEVYSEFNYELFMSQNTVSQDLTSRYFPNSRKCEENKRISEVKPSSSASVTDKNYTFNETGVTESEVNTIKPYEAEKRPEVLEEEWILETPVCNEALKKMRPEVLEEEWILETPVCNEALKKIRPEVLEEEWILETPVCNKALIKTNNTASTSQGILAISSKTNHETFYERDYVYKHVEGLDYKTPPYQNPLMRTNDSTNELKDEMSIKSFSSNKNYQKAGDKNKNSENTVVKQNDEWNYTSVFQEPLYNYSKKEWHTTHPVKTETSNESIDSSEQSFLASQHISFCKIQNFNSKDRRNESSNFAGRSLQRFISDIRNESGLNRSNRGRPAAKAEEFNPSKMKKTSFTI